MTKIICVDCNKKCERTGSRQKRCRKCRRLNKLERYRKRYRKKVEEFAKRRLNYNRIHNHNSYTYSYTYNSEYYKKHKKRIDLNNKRYYLKTRDRLRKQAFKILANGKSIICAKYDQWGCCQNPSDLDILQIDHINNDGAIQRKQICSGNTWYRWIINNPKKARETLQIICANAQWKKRRIAEDIKRKGFKI